MAMTEQEVADIFAAYDKAVLNGTANTQEWANRIKDARAGIVGYTQQLKASQEALKSSLLHFGKALADGETGAAVFNDSIKSGANTLSTWLSSKGPIGFVVGQVAQATAAYVGAVNKQADALYKSYQDISRTGAIGQGGMQEVYTSMQKLGYGIKELDKFGSLMAENSKDLAVFGGTAVKGSMAFANLGTELQHSPVTEQLLNMGISVDEINKGAAGFVRQQIALGQNQKTLGDSLSQGTLDYINELETISRLTGQTRQQQEEKIADAMAEQAFNAKIRQLKKQEAAGDENAKKQRIKLERANLILEGDIRKQFIRGAAGDISALGPLVNVAGAELIDAINDPNKTLGDVVGSITSGYEQLKSSGGEQLQMINAFNNTFGNTLEYEQLSSKIKGKNLDDLVEIAELNKKTTNAETKNLTEMQIAQRNARDNLQDFVNLGIEPVTKVVEILSKVIEWITDWIPGAGKAKRNREMQKQVEQTKTTKSVAEPIGPGTTPEAVAGKGLTGKSLSGMDKGFAEAIKRAADEYNQITGKTVNVTSALRDSEKQRELHEAYISGKSKFPAAPPGTSKHERGLAVDVDLASANELDRLGLLSKNGLSRPVPRDPIHISAQDGFDGILSGPTTGYQPQITMHGTESLTIEPVSGEAEMFKTQQNEAKTGILTEHLSALDTLYRTIEKQNAVANKILQSTS